MERRGGQSQEGQAGQTGRQARDPYPENAALTSCWRTCRLQRHGNCALPLAPTCAETPAHRIQRSAAARLQRVREAIGIRFRCTAVHTLPDRHDSRLSTDPMPWPCRAQRGINGQGLAVLLTPSSRHASCSQPASRQPAQPAPSQHTCIDAQLFEVVHLGSQPRKSAALACRQPAGLGGCGAFRRGGLGVQRAAAGRAVCWPIGELKGSSHSTRCHVPPCPTRSSRRPAHP